MAGWSRELLDERVFVEELTAFCLKAMDACGMRKASAQATADALVTTDTWGIHTHGSKQLRPLLGLRPGRMDPKAVPEVVAEGPAWALVDGHSAIAPASACAGMEAAMRKAKAAGIGYAGVFGSNHFGAAAYYAAMALRNDMIGIAMTNVNPLVTVTGGKTAVLGTNPIAYAAPAGEEPPILFDIATSVVAASKVITARALGTTIPDHWLVDQEGRPTTDPSRYPDEGALQPMTGHKGYGLALLVEILAAVLTGSQMMSEVKIWLGEDPGPLSQGHAFVAIEIDAIMGIDRFKARMDAAIREIRDSPKATGSDRIYLPGEMEWEKRETALREGMLLPEDVWQRLAGLAEDFGLDLAELVR